jgi:hypothetical protein
MFTFENFEFLIVINRSLEEAKSTPFSVLLYGVSPAPINAYMQFDCTVSSTDDSHFPSCAHAGCDELHAEAITADKIRKIKRRNATPSFFVSRQDDCQN